MGPTEWTTSGPRPGSMTLFNDSGFDKNAHGQFRDAGILIPLAGQEGVITTRRTVTHPDGTIDEYDVPVSAKLYVSDPSDGLIKNFAAGFGAEGFTVSFDEFGTQNSTVIAAFNQQIIQSLLTAEVITAEQAATAQAGLAAGVELAEILRDFGISAIGP